MLSNSMSECSVLNNEGKNRSKLEDAWSCQYGTEGNAEMSGEAIENDEWSYQALC